MIVNIEIYPTEFLVDISALPTVFNVEISQGGGGGGGETLTAEQIKALYESNANTNAFTDNEKTKLAGLENYNDSPIISALGNKVDKVSGKSLSTNDYSDSEKTKLAGLNNFDPTPINEQLELKANQLTTYTKTEVDGLISATYRAKGSVNNFASLPTTGNKQGDAWNLIDTGANYVWVLNLNNTGIAGWDKLSGVVDLSSYATISAMNTALALKVDKIEGKGLSESDFTSAEKTKLSEIETGANNYVLPATSGTVLGGVKEVYLTQSAYNALTPKLTDVKYHIEKI